MVNEVIPKTQYPGEYRRCFIETVSGIDFTVWYNGQENSEIEGIQIEYAVGNIIEIRNTKGKFKFSKYRRDNVGEYSKDFLIKTDEDIDIKNVKESMPIFAFNKSVSCFLEEAIISYHIDRK